MEYLSFVLGYSRKPLTNVMTSIALDLGFQLRGSCLWVNQLRSVLCQQDEISFSNLYSYRQDATLTEYLPVQLPGLCF